MSKSEVMGKLTEAEFERLEHLMTRYGAKTWVIAGWTAGGPDTLYEALVYEVGYREALAYKILESGFDENNAREFVLEDNPELKDDELEKAVREQFDFECEIMWSDLDAAKRSGDEEDMLMAVGLLWDHVQVTEVECASSFCDERLCVDAVFWCPDCKDPLCPEHAPWAEDLQCVCCGYEVNGVDIMRMAIADRARS